MFDNFQLGSWLNSPVKYAAGLAMIPQLPVVRVSSTRGERSVLQRYNPLSDWCAWNGHREHLTAWRRLPLSAIVYTVGRRGLRRGGQKHEALLQGAEQILVATIHAPIRIRD